MSNIYHNVRLTEVEFCYLINKIAPLVHSSDISISFLFSLFDAFNSDIDHAISVKKYLNSTKFNEELLSTIND